MYEHVLCSLTHVKFVFDFFASSDDYDGMLHVLVVELCKFCALFVVDSCQLQMVKIKNKFKPLVFNKNS